MVKMKNQVCMPESWSGIPASGEAHVWYGWLDNEAMSFRGMFSPDEKERIQKYHDEENKKRYIVRHGILRTLLGRYLNIGPGIVRFEVSGNGKPKLAREFSARELYFSMSHSKGLALFAFTQESDVGIDVEFIRDIFNMERIMARFFSPGERKAFQISNDEEKKATFFKIWTRKEALLKASGEGISDRLNEVDTSSVKVEYFDGIFAMPVLYKDETWFIYDFHIDGGYRAVLASRGRPIKLTIYEWDNCHC